LDHRLRAGPRPARHPGNSFLKHIVFEDPDWDFRSFRFSRADGLDDDIDFTDYKLGAMFNAIDPNLRPFQANGGKLIQYHGWSDPDISPLNSINYYESVVRSIGAGGNHGLRDTREFYRLFMVPGMQHCSGGAAPSTFDMLNALENWWRRAWRRTVSSLPIPPLARWTAPPLVPYPQEARWKGSGSTDDAANFACALGEP